jgi:predicted metal-binding protein
MPNHILFVCKSCNAVHSDNFDYDKAEGVVLLNQLLDLHQDWSHRNELEICAVGCLWTCSRPCSVAFSSTNKTTYLFTNIPATAAEALLQFGQLYLTNKDGNIPWQQFPEVLQSAEVAKIPSQSR